MFCTQNITGTKEQNNSKPVYIGHFTVPLLSQSYCVNLYQVTVADTPSSCNGLHALLVI